ncbi:MAG: hypothetical protein E6G97_15635 [Alphaproteobacteria bacterium]|nr:MAG: hypothetical protein E6G97_15635 [Alphaproteobacteria bacterium]
MRTLIICLVWLVAGDAVAQEDYETWRPHTATFPSTGGNGVIIGEYRPVIAGDKCTTDFTATLPDGKVYYNSVEFDAVPAQGGTLCTNGRWRAKDGSAHGTTPYRVFFKDGAVRGSP